MAQIKYLAIPESYFLLLQTELFPVAASCAMAPLRLKKNILATT